MAAAKTAKRIVLHIETLAALLLLIVLAALTVLLIFSTGRAYRGIVETGSQTQQVRTGLLFVATKVRQGDVAGGVEVRSSRWGNALVLTQTTDGAAFEDWIFYEGGTLREALIKKGGTINPGACPVISTLRMFSLKQTGRQLTVTAGAPGKDAGGPQTLTLTLRTQ